MKGIRHILVPTDFGEVGARALGYALDLARQIHADVHLLHVATEPVSTPPNGRDRERLREIWQKLDLLPPPGEDQDLTITREVVNGVPVKLPLRLSLKIERKFKRIAACSRFRQPAVQVGHGFSPTAWRIRCASLRSFFWSLRVA